jgi:hypothetical protein
MAILTNTKTVYGLGSTAGAREDLEDTIWDLYPDDTYCLTNFDRVKVSSTTHEWMSDSLAAAGANAQIDGDDLQASGFSTYTNPTRLLNYTQIFRKAFLVSGSAEATNYAGRKSEIARQAMKQMRELKNDMEYAIVRNQATSAGGAGTARTFGSMESWIASTDNSGNGLRATTSASASTAAYSSGVTAPTDGTTTGALTETKFREMLALVWADGGDASVVLTGTAQKTAIGGFSGVATKFNEIKGAKAATIIGAVDMYVSDVGNHSIQLHRHARASVVLGITPDMWSVGFLRSPQMQTLAKTGDGEKRLIIGEMTLICRNPNASGKVAACA